MQTVRVILAKAKERKEEYQKSQKKWDIMKIRPEDYAATVAFYKGKEDEMDWVIGELEKLPDSVV